MRSRPRGFTGGSWVEEVELTPGLEDKGTPSRDGVAVLCDESLLQSPALPSRHSTSTGPRRCHRKSSAQLKTCRSPRSPAPSHEATSEVLSSSHREPCPHGWEKQGRSRHSSLTNAGSSCQSCYQHPAKLDGSVATPPSIESTSECLLHSWNLQAPACTSAAQGWVDHLVGLCELSSMPAVPCPPFWSSTASISPHGWSEQRIQVSRPRSGLHATRWHAHQAPSQRSLTVEAPDTNQTATMHPIDAKRTYRPFS